MSVTESTDRLAELVDKKHEVLGQLRTLSQYQLRLAGHDEYLSDLMRVLAAKQSLIERLSNIDQQLNPFRSEDPDARVWRSPEDRQRCSKMAGECEQLLSELKKLEQASTQTISKRRDDVAKQLKETNTAVDSNAAYNNLDSTPTHRGLDLTAE